ncbi:MAG: phenylalanine--tRNA ligase subunit alpha [Thermoplasmatota archaeon]
MDLDKIIKELSQNEKKVLLALEKLNGKASPEDILKNGDFNQQVEVMNASAWLQSKNLVKIEDHVKTVYFLGDEGKKFLEKGLPEKIALNFIHENGGTATLSDLSKVLTKDEIPVAVGWLRKKDWAVIKKNKETIFEITETGKKALKSETKDEHILIQLNKTPNIEIDKNEIRSLLSRKNVVKEKEIISCFIILTENGKKVLEKGLTLADEISQITSSIIKSGEWKTKTIRPYDVNAFAPTIYGGKPHPLVELIDKIRHIFLEMGFEEIQGNFVESCFWNMDMLFIPQDHPAREMQDTLYCKNPSKIILKEKNLIDVIAKVHENGGNTKSTGWGYKFSKSETERVLLRTHTTVNTIRYLYHNPNPPAKVFSIGRVFRKENIDSTHLPEFYQIEGIINEENTNFRQLIGVLKEFYKRIGFEKIRFRPGYFPYTEPSMEVDVFWNNKWMELGGSGIFRPEVTEPIGVKNPVLAWGLGLERLAMLKFGLNDIRDLYISDLGWLRKKPLI